MAMTQYSTAIRVVVHFENNKTAEENSLPERFFFSKKSRSMPAAIAEDPI